MELLLTKVPVENECQALKVIEVAKQRGLSSVGNERLELFTLTLIIKILNCRKGNLPSASNKING